MQVGKQLRPLTKHPRKNIQDLASDIFALWKNVVLEQTIVDKKNGDVDNINSVKAQPGNAENVKAEKLQKTTHVKVEKSTRPKRSSLRRSIRTVHQNLPKLMSLKLL